MYVTESKLTVEQQLAALASGKSIALGYPAQPDCWVQASWLGELYYITGPHFEACVPEIDMGELSATGLANGVAARLLGAGWKPSTR